MALVYPVSFLVVLVMALKDIVGMRHMETRPRGPQIASNLEALLRLLLPYWIGSMSAAGDPAMAAALDGGEQGVRGIFNHPQDHNGVPILPVPQNYVRVINEHAGRAPPVSGGSPRGTSMLRAPSSQPFSGSSVGAGNGGADRQNGHQDDAQSSSSY